VSHAETHYEHYLIRRAENAEHAIQRVRTYIDDNRPQRLMPGNPALARSFQHEWDEGYDTALQDILDILDDHS